LKIQKEKYINHSQTYSSQQTLPNEVIMFSIEFLPEEMIEHIASFFEKPAWKLYQWIPFHLFQGLIIGRCMEGSQRRIGHICQHLKYVGGYL
jgi:hypothetical protein